MAKDERSAPADVDALVAAMEAVVAAMPPLTRDVYVRHRLDGWSYDRIAKAYRIGVANVEGHIAQAILALDEGLRSHGL